MELLVVGQRWVNDAELQLGLGTLISEEGRTITLMFAAAEETRTYAAHRSPLSRVKFVEGERIRNQDGYEITIDQVIEKNGLYFYHGMTDSGEKLEIPEGNLDPHTSFNLPNQRLFIGQIDRPSHFELRRKASALADYLAHSELRGLTGGRTSLIPHQLYIANEVAKRYAPRVLLADEVGLGKTIEAGLILNQQVFSGRAQRVLILVPETLLHQWLVEMLRRFNLHFSLFGENRVFNEEGGIDVEENPFETEQLIICSIDFLITNPEAQELVCEASWDLLIVDEAHHLEWSETQVSPEYRLVEHLSSQTSGLLLLTATPEQLGKSAHFARLRLLDPDRFHSYTDFAEEEQEYRLIADLIDEIKAADPKTLANVDWQNRLQDYGQEIAEQAANIAESGSNSIEPLIDRLLDRHGTGRVLFRNTRNTIKGFPKRKLHKYPLDNPIAYTISDQEKNELPVKALLHPELNYQLSDTAEDNWTNFDPRIEWLLSFLSTNKKQKVLVIAASEITALDIAEHIRLKTGEPPAVFHEAMSIIERDRAAAYFADEEYGSQSLICSEIGSEGRNFQFAHHLVLFDLPLNPDLLEQRIGRLDRIGQTETINIHLPYLKGTAQESLATIYHNGIGAFENISSAALTLFNEHKTKIVENLRQGTVNDSLLADIKKRYEVLEENIQAGRDRLLEYNSCRPRAATALMESATKYDAETPVPDFIQEFSDIYGIEHEIQSNQRVVLRPTENMMAPLPALPDEGMTLTYQRDTALSQEDLHFMSADHPLLVQALDSILSSETGSTSVVSISYKAVEKGSILVECFFSIEGISGRGSQSLRYLPSTGIRTIIDQKKRSHTALTSDVLEKYKQPVKRSIGAKIVASQRSVIEDLLDASKNLAAIKSKEIKEKSLQQAQQDMQREIERLTALSRVNPNVRESEVEASRAQLEATLVSLEKVNFKLDAIRILINT